MLENCLTSGNALSQGQHQKNRTKVGKDNRHDRQENSAPAPQHHQMFTANLVALNFKDREVGRDYRVASSCKKLDRFQGSSLVAE